MLPLYILPLAGALEAVKELSTTMIESTAEFAEGFITVGKGIGAIMLLFVAIYYIISILDGGKFQMKMLFPLLLFLFVCNFTFVSKPVTYFTRTITSTCTEVVGHGRKELFDKYGAKGSSMIDLFWALKHEDTSTPKQPDVEQGNTTTDGQDDRSWWEEKLNNIKLSIEEVIRDMERNVVGSVSVSDDTDKRSQVEQNAKEIPLSHLTFTAIFAAIFSFIISAIGVACQAMGIVLTCLVIAFGPITWAFAIFPGRQSNIMSWFIRICQFSLYTPIFALIDLFTLNILCLMCEATECSFIALFAVLTCNFVCVTSIPTIASMIIEGAQGAVSLSSGLQAIGAAYTAGSAFIFGAKAKKFNEKGLVGNSEELLNKTADTMAKSFNDIQNSLRKIGGMNNGGI